MTRFKLLAGSALLTIGLAACASNDDAGSASSMASSNISAFNQALQTGYARLSANENDEFDYVDSDQFEAKSMAAGKGGDVLPWTLDGWQIDDKYVADLNAARAALIDARDKGAADSSPQALADAQTNYDCWVQEAEEDLQPDHIRACRAAYESAMARITYPAPEPEPEEIAEPVSFNIYFAFDSSEIDATASTTVADIAQYVDEEAATSVVLLGHADKAGNSEYNDALAQTRSEAVRGALIALGVPESMIEISSYGENRPAVDTEDGVAEQSNRRVEVTVHFD